MSRRSLECKVAPSPASSAKPAFGVVRLYTRRGAGIENPSETVKRHVGTRGVAEPAALLRAGAKALLLPKQVYMEPEAGRSMTLAVAHLPYPKRHVV